jgi:hypothetical protein
VLAVEALGSGRLIRLIILNCDWPPSVYQEEGRKVVGNINHKDKRMLRNTGSSNTRRWQQLVYFYFFILWEIRNQRPRKSLMYIHR